MSIIKSAAGIMYFFEAELKVSTGWHFSIGVYILAENKLCNKLKCEFKQVLYRKIIFKEERLFYNP